MAAGRWRARGKTSAPGWELQRRGRSSTANSPTMPRRNASTQAMNTAPIMTVTHPPTMSDRYSCSVTTIAVVLEPTASADTVTVELERSFPGTTTISNPGEAARANPSFEIVTKAVEDEFAKAGKSLPYTIGTMIEIPRAALIADQIANEADFFSFGTNDLTQTGIGISRDDAELGFLGAYVDNEVIEKNPFESLDQEGVGQLVAMGVEKGRKTKPGLKTGVCGEHGGDPDSIDFFHRAGLSYVSCSPFRVPIARLAAARAALKNK